MPIGFTDWQDIFSILRTIHPWNPDDRLSQEMISDWQAMIDEDLRKMQRIEIEMWFYEDQQNRATAYRRVKKAVDQAGGTTINHAVILDGLATLVGQWRHQQLLPSALTAHQRHPLSPAEMLFHLGH